MFYEMRTYIAAPGKLEALQKRFREQTLRLFEKNNIKPVGFWLPDKPDNVDLVYLVAYPNREAREKNWKAFQNDPEWIAAKAESEKDGILVAKIIVQFLNPTDFSPLN